MCLISFYVCLHYIPNVVFTQISDALVLKSRDVLDRICPVSMKYVLAILVTQTATALACSVALVKGVNRSWLFIDKQNLYFILCKVFCQLMQINEYNQNQGIKKYWLIVYHKQRFVKNVSFYNTFLVFYRLILWLPFYHTNLLPFLTHSSLNSMADLVI